METRADTWIFNTAEKRFQRGSVSFSDRFEEVSLDDTPSSFDGGQCVIPGLVDIHMHIESSMLTPTAFAQASLPHGTTTIVSDCHEVANVAGVEGLKQFMALPVSNSTFYAIPSSVPASSPDLETSGGSFDVHEVTELCAEKRVIALGEVMNANDLFSSEDNRTKRIIRAFRADRPFSPIEGHCPRLTGSELDRFIRSGVDSDHTEQTPDSVREKIEKGMFLELQYKSITPEVIHALKPCYDGLFSLCTDDVLPDVLVTEGQLDRVLRKAISCGLSPERAIYAATWAPSVRMRLFDRGWIAPGKRADFIVLDDLATFTINQVYVAGRLVYDRIRKILPPQTTSVFPPAMLRSIIRGPVTANEFVLRAHHPGTQRILTIGHRAESTMTVAQEVTVTVPDDLRIPMDGLNLLASVERYGHQSPIIPVPLSGGLDKRGAICTSWAHDSHNLLVMATDAELAARAVNLVREKQGGIACVDPNGTLFVPLSYGGIVSTEAVDTLAKGIREVRDWLKDHGYHALDELMSFAVLALPVSPVLKVTDKGMVDVRSKKIIDWRQDA
jgi:adenine deaminase